MRLILKDIIRKSERNERQEENCMALAENAERDEGKRPLLGQIESME